MAFHLDIALSLLEVKKNQWKSQSELEAMQEDKLRSLVSYASMNVPHYRETLKGKAVRDRDDLAALPIITRKDVQGDKDSFVSARMGESSLTAYKTSGSTGVPLTVYYSPYDSAYAAALRYLWVMENGVGPFDLQAELTYFRKEPHALERLGIFRKRYLSVLDEDEKNLRILKSLRPPALISYPSTLLQLASLNMSSGDALEVRTAFSSAEVLTENARNYIKRSFNCSLSERYGTIETGSVAWECEEGSLHVYSDSILVEILDDHGEPVRGGSHGDVVLTPLWKYSMPFIRYRIGDMASWGSRCRCGRGSHVLKSLQGRSNQFMVLPSGRLYMSTLISAFMKRVPGLLHYQTVQESEDLLCVKFVPDGTVKDVHHQIVEAVRKSLPEPMRIEAEEVDRIPPGPVGKLCNFISKVRTA